MRRCLEAGLDPPLSGRAAVDRRGRNSVLSGLAGLGPFGPRKNRAAAIQIVADGPKLAPSLIVFDEGEGTAPGGGL